MNGLGLGYDEICGGGDTENKSDQKPVSLEEHSTITMDGAVIDLKKERKAENAQRAEDDDQDNLNDCAEEMKRKLEKVDNFQEDYTPTGSNSAEVGSESANGNQRTVIVDDAAAVAAEEAVVFEEAAASEEVTTISAVGSASSEGLKQTPIALPNTARWWLLRLSLVWAVPVIGFGVWHGVGMVSRRYKSTT